MKIYYASQSFYPLIGGVSTYLLNLCREMVNRDNEVVEVHLRPSGEVNHDVIRGIQIQRVPKEPIDEDIMKGYGEFKELVYKECHENNGEFEKEPDQMQGYESFSIVNHYFGEELRELLKKQPADIVHIHDFQLLFAYKYIPRGTPLILTWHIPIIPNMSHFLSRFLIKHLREYDKVVFSSPEYIKAIVKLGFPKEKTALINPLANTEMFKKLDIDEKMVREEYKLPVDSKIIMCVQRIDQKSGHTQLIKAMSQVLKEVPDAKLVFVGGKSISSKLCAERQVLYKEVMNLVKSLGVKKNVIFTGTIDYHKLPYLYNTCDVVALCSKNEGFGLAVTEGMACGKPIVGTRIGGIPRQVKNKVNGFLVNVGDVNATANRLIQLLKSKKLREEMGEKSLEIVKKRFRKEIGIQKHLILYRKLRRQKDEFYKVEYLKKSEVMAIITDLDRTIIDKPAKIDFDPKDFDIDILRELYSLNIDLILATGRNIHFVRKLCKKFNIWRCAIAENGAVIYFPKTKKTLTINTYFMTKAKRLVRELNLPGTTIGKVITSNRMCDKKFILKRLGRLAYNLSVVDNVNEFMLLPEGVDKGLAVRLACHYMKIRTDKTLIIGDAENDIDLFMNPGFKIALANSNMKLKKLANQIVNKPASEGIREVIRRLQM